MRPAGPDTVSGTLAGGGQVKQRNGADDDEHKAGSFGFQAHGLSKVVGNIRVKTASGAASSIGER